MNVLLVYVTNSGGTAAAQMIAGTLTAKGALVTPSLKVNGFYMKPDAGEMITKWAAELPI